jgi:hypothetical protein
MSTTGSIITQSAGYVWHICAVFCHVPSHIYDDVLIRWYGTQTKGILHYVTSLRSRKKTAALKHGTWTLRLTRKRFICNMDQN